MVRYFHKLKRQTEAYYATVNSNRTDKTSPITPRPAAVLSLAARPDWLLSVSIINTPLDTGRQQHLSNISAAN